MRKLGRRILANWYYMRRPLLEFLPLILAMVVLVLLGGLCFFKLGKSPSYAHGLYVTYCLLLMEHVTDYAPEHWVLQTLYVVLPIVGLVVILDGIVRFSYHVLRRNETGKEWVSSVAKTLNDHVVLCGLGKMGLRVLQELVKLGESVVVLEKNSACPHIAYARRHNFPVLIGHSREEGIFNELNVASAKSIICATDDDLANLEMALDARAIKPGIRVVLRMFDQELASKVRDAFDMQLAFSTSAVSAPLFATASSDSSILNSFYVGDQLLVVAHLVIRPDSALAERTIRDLAGEHQLFVLYIEDQDRRTLYPPGDAVLRVGDQLTVQTDPATLNRLHERNRDPQPY